MNQFHGNALVVDSLIIFGTDKGRAEIGVVYALNRFDGRLVWKKLENSGATSEISFDDDSLVFVVTRDDRLSALSIHTGEVVWSFATGWQRKDDEYDKSKHAIPRIHSPALWSQDRVLFVGQDQTIYCLQSSSGEKLWQVNSSLIVTSQPLLHEGRLLVGLEDHTISAFDLKDGRKLYSDSTRFLALGGMSMIDGRLVFLGADEGNDPRDIVAIIPETDSLVWVAPLDDRNPLAFWYVPRIHIRDNEVIVGSTSGKVVGLDSRTGQMRWQYHTNNPIRGIGHSDSLVFVGTYGGVLYALKVGE